MKQLRRRRLVVVTIFLVVVSVAALNHQDLYQPVSQVSVNRASKVDADIDKLPVKGRAPKTGYKRSQFGNGWRRQEGCDTRNIILYRDLKQAVVDDNCRVRSGRLDDPYTGKLIDFVRGPEASQLVQIDHVVALSNAWQTGAQQLTRQQREDFANDPLNLLAVDGAVNQQKSDGDAATWLPPNKAFRCQYVERQVSVKLRYSLWVTAPEKQAIKNVLAKC